MAIVSLFGVLALFGGGVTTAFNFGKTVESRFLSSLPSPTPRLIIARSAVVTISRAGTIKATYQLPVPSVMLNAAEDSSSSSSSSIQNPTPTPVIVRYILVSGNSITYLSPSSSVALKNYLNLRVLITGSYNNATNMLTISRSEDIEILQ